MFRRKMTNRDVKSLKPETVERIMEVCEAICCGDFEARILGVPAEDSVERELCLKINEMIDRTDAYVRESTACLGFISDNQYFRRIAQNGMVGNFGEATRQINKAADSIEAKMNQFQEMVASINELSSKLNTSVASMHGSASGAAEKSVSVAAGAEEAGVNTQTVATAADQLNASIQEINRQVNLSANLTTAAFGEAEQASVLVNGLSEASAKIEQVVGLINDIAGQTNLLALNATIEAARAGDAGKGFTVVASEVKALATQTAQATEDIKKQVDEIQKVSNSAVAAIVEITKSIGNINESSSGIAAAMEEQGAATHEIARNVQEAATGVTDITMHISGVNQNIDEVRTIASQVKDVSDNLTMQADTLQKVLTG